MRFRRRRRSTPRRGRLQRRRRRGAKRKPAAGSSSTGASSSLAGSTLAEADLRIAKANINDLQTQLAEVVSQRDDLHLQLHKSMDLGNQQLTTAARTANETAHAHARQLRTTKATTGDAIAKMKAMRQHAHAFAEVHARPYSAAGRRLSTRLLVLGRIQRPPRRQAKIQESRLRRAQEEAGVGQLCRGLQHRRVHQLRWPCDG